MLEKRDFEKDDFMYRLSTTITIAAGLFSVIVFVLLVINYMQVVKTDPVDDPVITEMRKAYADAPEKDEALASRIRLLDLSSRKVIFTNQAHQRVGGMLLLVGIIIFMVSFKCMTWWRPDVPELAEEPAAEREWRSYAKSRPMLVWACVLLLAVGLGLAYTTESHLLAEERGETKTAANNESGEAPDAPAVVFPEWDEVQANWPTFRGPGANGIAFTDNAPTEWDVATGAGVKWKIPVPRQGTNSPVVWGNRLYMSGADESIREVYCYDTETGDQLWTTEVNLLPAGAEAPDVSEETGFAASTMAVHGEYVYAVFANGDIACLNSEGELIWGFNFGMVDNHYGYSTSLLAYQGLLFLQLDNNDAAEMIALDAATGDEVWADVRDKISWSSPILAETAQGPQVITAAEVDVTGYDPLTGDRLWAESILGGEVAPSPAYSNGIVFAANEYASGAGIALGEDPLSQVAWEYDNLLPEVASPVGDGERFYFGTAMGELVALNAATGEEIWVEELGDMFYSSPVLVGDRIYIFDTEGVLFIVKAGPEYELIAQHEFGEPIFATPAVMEGRLYVRTEEHLYCIGS